MFVCLFHTYMYQVSIVIYNYIYAEENHFEIIFGYKNRSLSLYYKPALVLVQFLAGDDGDGGDSLRTEDAYLLVSTAISSNISFDTYLR